jgi:hypothetical protein
MDNALEPVEEIVEGIVQDPINPQTALADQMAKGKNKKYVRFIMAALGSIPWVGSFISAAASFSAETEQGKTNEYQKLWLDEHQEKIKELARTLDDIIDRLDNFGEEFQTRIQSPEYLSLVREAFRSWDEAETSEKRQMLKKLITNAAATKMTDDGLIQLFISWIKSYHEFHFMVIKEIYKSPRITRGIIWDSIKGTRPRDDSSEADLFKLLIRDLSTGGVIRQEKEINAYGQFMKSEPSTSRTQNHGDRTMESPFDISKPYVLTELGKEFVHYVLEDVVTQISSQSSS